MDNSINELINLQATKEVTSLFKFYLELLETLKLPPEQYEVLRKQVLNHGNDSIRNILQFLELFDFTINAAKVKEAASKRVIVYSKTITSQPIII